MPYDEKPVTFASGALELEGLLAVPKLEPGLSPPKGGFPGLVLCHPHPNYGGDMSNNVVAAVASGLARRGIATLCFNFRGVGGSRGVYDSGRGEQEDARAAIHYLAAQPGIDGDRIGLVGYSFGATVAVAVAAQEPLVSALVAISLPGARLDAEAFQGRALLKLFLTGGQDRGARPELLREQLSRIPPPVVAHVAPEADHFWHGDEPWLVDKVGSFLQSFWADAVAST